MRTTPILLIALAAAACMAGSPPPPPPDMQEAPSGLMMAGVGLDPVGQILEDRDSLQLSDSVTLALVRLNLRLYTRNSPLRRRFDAIFATERLDPREIRGDTTRIRPAVRDSLRPLVAQMRANSDAARDTAWAMLTEQQQEKARVLRENRMRQLDRMGGSPRERPQ